MTRLSLHEYQESRTISAQGYSFYALVAALFRDADTDNLEKLKITFPGIWESFYRRYNSGFGIVPEWDNITAQEYFDRFVKNDL
jgi:hypothetical protein